MKAAGVLPQAGHKARELQEGADRLRAEAEALKDRARLEDLSSGPWRSQEQQEGQQDLLLLDGHLAGGEPYQKCAPGELCQDGCGCSSAEGQGHEGRCPRNQDLNIEECRGEFQEL